MTQLLATALCSRFWLCKADAPPLNFIVLCYNWSICLTSKCVFTVCVGRSSNEFRVQLDMDTVHYMGLILTPPPSTSYYSEHRHQHRSLFIHLVWAVAQRGEREGSERTGKDRVYQIALVPWLLFVLFCFWFCNICSGKAEAVWDKRAI